VPLLRLRSDEQLLALFRAGNEDAFRVIHDRYRQRLFAYARQMLPGSSQDAEDALQDVFVRAYSGLRANRRELALRPWLYRVAHNRCIDELRRPIPPPPAVLHQSAAPAHDPIAEVEQRESLRRLIADLRRLPAQQRSALLMRELGGMSYAEVAAAMDVSVPAVKSLLVRARIGLTLASEARDTACVKIRDELTLAHDRGVRCSGTVRRHVTDCGGCREFQSQLRRSRRQFAALTPTLGPIGVIANLLGIGGGGAAGGGAGVAATGGAAATGAGVGATGGATATFVGGGTVASVGTLGAGASHMATLIAAAVVTAGGAVAIQHSIAPVHHRHALHAPASLTRSEPAAVPSPYRPSRALPASSAPNQAASAKPAAVKPASTTAHGGATTSTVPTSISGGDNIIPTASPPDGSTDPAGTSAAGATPTGTGTSTGTAGILGTAQGTGTSATATTGTASATGPSGSSTSTSSPATSMTGTASSPTGTSAPSTTGTTGSTAGGSGATTSASTGSGAGPTIGT
jgi:RNA polymerase sigma factor (sigma-70 family)